MIRALNSGFLQIILIAGFIHVHSQEFLDTKKIFGQEYLGLDVYQIEGINQLLLFSESEVSKADLSNPDIPDIDGILDPGFKIGDARYSNGMLLVLGSKDLIGYGLPGGNVFTPHIRLSALDKFSAMDIAGDILYLLDSTQGLQIYRLNGRNAPTLLKSFNQFSKPGKPAGIMNKVYAGDSTLVITDTTGNIYLLNVKNPSDPRLTVGASPYGFTDYFGPIKRRGDFVYQVQFGDLLIFKIKGDRDLGLLGEYASSNLIVNFCISGDTAYIVNNRLGLIRLDIRDPASISAIDTTVFSNYGPLAFFQERMYASQNMGLKTYNMSNPRDPKLTHAMGLGGIEGVSSKGSWTLIYSTSNGFQVLSRGINGIWKVESFFDPEEKWFPIMSAVLGDGFVYVAAEKQGFVTFDISQMRATPIVSLATNQDAFIIHSEGHHVFIDGCYGIGSFDVTDSRNPRRAGTFSSAMNGGFAVSNGLGLLPDGKNTKVISLADPNQMTQVGTIPSLGDVIAIQDTLAVCIVKDAIEIYNLKKPSAPVRLSRIESIGVGFPDVVHLNSPYLFISNEDLGILIFDLKDPRQPLLVQSMTDNYSEALHYSGGQLFLGTGSGLKVLSQKDPNRIFSRPIRKRSPSEKSVFSSGKIFLKSGQGGQSYHDISGKKYLRDLYSIFK